MRKSYSTFDYTVAITRKYRYLTFTCPELGIQVGTECLDLGKVSPERIGEQVLQLFERINARLHQCELQGQSPPIPGGSLSQFKGISGTQMLSIRDAAVALGISVPLVRQMVKKNQIQTSKTPGGHLRFSIDALTRYLIEH